MQNSSIMKHKNPNHILGLILLTCLGSALFLIGQVKNTSADEAQSRYSMIESENGIIRLDKKTGSMSNCKKLAGGWTCIPIKELSETDTKIENTELFAELQKANEALEKENQRLKQKIADLEFGLNEKPTDKKFKLPSDEEVDEAITYMEKMIRKFGGAMKRLREKHPDAPETEL